MGNEAILKLNKFAYKAYRFFTNKEILKIISHLSCVAFGFSLSESVIFIRYAPFGLAMLAAVNDKYIIGTLIGVFLGYFLNSFVHIPARYIAAIIVYLTVRWTLSHVEKITSHALYAPILSFVSCFSTGITISLVSSAIRNSALMYFCESLICAVSTYFFSKLFSAVSLKKPYSSFSLEEISGAGFFVSAVLISLTEFKLFDISLSSVLFSLFILISARLGGISSSCVCGICVSLVKSLSFVGIRAISGSFAAASLIAGIFAPINKILGALSFSLAIGVFSIELGAETNFINSIYESLIGGIVFILLPLQSPVNEPQVVHSSFDKMLSQRFNQAADAINDVCKIASEISSKLSSMCSHNVEDVFDKSIELTCKNCGLSLYCWGENYSENINNLTSLIPLLEENEIILSCDLNGIVTDKCQRKNELSENISVKYRDFIAAKTARLRSEALREIISGQFSAISFFIKEFTKSMYFDYKEDCTGKTLLEKEFSKFDIIPLEILCIQKNDGDYHINAFFEASDNPELELSVLLSVISRCYRRRFVGTLTRNGAIFNLIAHEKANIKIKIGASQISSKSSDLCGDSYSHFTDLFGNYIAILSDGMGTGGRAAIDSAMASGIMKKLVENGIGFDSALKITNYALISKSSDESLSTLDCAAINPYTRELTIYKAGSPMSIIKKDGKAKELFSSALPAGIVCDVEFAKIYETLDVGDMLVMITDGAVYSQSKWLSSLIENIDETDEQKIADEILDFAINMRPNDKADDISVLVLLAVSPDEA